MWYKASLATSLIIAAALLGSPASAATVTCGTGTGAGQRNFTLDVGSSVSCFATGSGNINGEAGDPIIGDPNTQYVLIDKVDSPAHGGGIMNGALTATLGVRDGNFSIDQSVFSSFTNILVAFKVGGGTRDPDWAVFALTGPFTFVNGVLSGLFDVDPDSGQGVGGGLSHANLYGIASRVVPGPIAGAGLPALMALGGLVWARRRKAAAAA
jgi:hypothetical protein